MTGPDMRVWSGLLDLGQLSARPSFAAHVNLLTGLDNIGEVCSSSKDKSGMQVNQLTLLARPRLTWTLVPGILEPHERKTERGAG
jgi:hypothetical protein